MNEKDFGSVVDARGIVFQGRIGDMRRGETGYTVPWAYNPDTRQIDKTFSIERVKGGTAELFVKYLGDNRYDVVNEGDYAW